MTGDEARASFREFRPGIDDEDLIDLLTTETWPLRLHPTLSRADVEKDLAEGAYGTGKDLCFLIEAEHQVVGLVRVEPLDQDRFDPGLDIRIRAAWRGRGLGLAAVHHITAEFFNRFPDRFRIEGQTRRDNIAMRKVFQRAGWVKEAVYRQAWEPDEAGARKDGLGYAILRSDWETGGATMPDMSPP